MQKTDQSQPDTWSAAQYSKFEKERNRPIVDLLSRISTEEINKVIDLGCGPGNSTAFLRQYFPGAVITGIDSSTDMIRAAHKRLPNLQFEVADINQWEGNGLYDLIFANASLQWVPNHATLFPALIKKLTKGGVLAVQMPDNLDEHTHRLMRVTAAKAPWAEKLAIPSKRLPREGAEWYYQILRSSVETLDIWRTTYYHPLFGGVAAIVEWLKGTGLRPFLDPLTADEKEAFLAQYTQEISKVYPVFSDGSVLLPFPRLFMVATNFK